MAVVTPTDRSKSIRNRCAIKVLGGVFCVVTLLFGFSVGVGAFGIGLSLISSFFLFIASVTIDARTSLIGYIVYNVTASDTENDNLIYDISCGICPFDILDCKLLAHVYINV